MVIVTFSEPKIPQDDTVTAAPLASGVTAQILAGNLATSLAPGPVTVRLERLTFAAHAGAWYGKVVLVGLSWAFFNHMCSGIRHFVLDIGAGFELKNNALWSALTPILAIVLTIAAWAAVLYR